MGEKANKELMVYECKFCKTLRRTLKGIERHVERCPRNPASKACATCSYYVGNFPVGRTRLTDVFFCHEKICFHPDRAFSDKVEHTMTNCGRWR